MRTSITASVLATVIGASSPAAASEREHDDILPSTLGLGANGGIGFTAPGAAGGARASVGWGSAIGMITLGYRGLVGRRLVQHQAELLVARYLSPADSSSLYAGGGIAVGTVGRGGAWGSGPGLVLMSGIELNRFGSARPSFGVRAELLGATSQSPDDRRTIIGGALTGEATVTFGGVSSGADASYQAPPDPVPSDAERAWLARFFLRAGSDVLTSTEGTAPHAALVRVGIGSSILSFEGGLRIANALRSERYLTQLELEARAYLSPRAQHSVFIAIGSGITYSDLRRVDRYVYQRKGDPGVFGALGVQFFRRESVRLDVVLRGDAIALARTEQDGQPANTGFMGIASIGLGVTFGGANSGARDAARGPFERQ